MDKVVSGGPACAARREAPRTHPRPESVDCGHRRGLSLRRADLAHKLASAFLSEVTKKQQQLYYFVDGGVGAAGAAGPAGVVGLAGVCLTFGNAGAGGSGGLVVTFGGAGGVGGTGVATAFLIVTSPSVVSTFTWGPPTPTLPLSQWASPSPCDSSPKSFSRSPFLVFASSTNAPCSGSPRSTDPCWF